MTRTIQGCFLVLEQYITTLIVILYKQELQLLLHHHLSPHQQQSEARSIVRHWCFYHILSLQHVPSVTQPHSIGKRSDLFDSLGFSLLISIVMAPTVHVSLELFNYNSFEAYFLMYTIVLVFAKKVTKPDRGQVKLVMWVVNTKLRPSEGMYLVDTKSKRVFGTLIILFNTITFIHIGG